MSGLYDDDETVPEYWRPRHDPTGVHETARMAYVPPFEPPPPRPARTTRRRFPAAAAGLLLAIAIVFGMVIGHAVWTASAPTTSVAQNGLLNPTNGGGGQSPSTGFGGGSATGGGSAASGGSGASSGAPSTRQTSLNAESIAAKVSPGLVDINSTFGYEHARGAGTGIVLTADGMILTNNHVINLASKISVTDIGNGRTYPATVVGYDKAKDIAVLKLQGASGLQTARLGDSSSVAAGEAVLAIGNAGGTGGTPSTAAGSVLALGRSITAGDSLDGTSERLSNLIEVAADVQPGDSGGPLVNASGEVIGVDTAASEGFSFRGAAASEGFAIPINEALAVARQIQSGQGSDTVHVGPTAFLGVYILSGGSPAGPGGYYGSPPSGVTISGVASGGAAEAAGLAGGDTITSLDGQTVDSPSSLTKIIIGMKPGQAVSIGWDDPTGQSHTATVQLGTGPPA
ncbi:MAG: hypothetical protein QOH12_155 [Solirubrobacteraceae bacterium]|nr:hypothetical protein [Solirubrobacteraceae bacterium]